MDVETFLFEISISYERNPMHRKYKRLGSIVFDSRYPPFKLRKDCYPLFTDNRPQMRKRSSYEKK
jgi:hypothetical protein